MKLTDPTIRVTLITLLMQMLLFSPVLAIDKRTAASSTKDSTTRAKKGTASQERTAYDNCVEGDRSLAAGEPLKALESYKAAAALDPTSYSGAIHSGMASAFKAQKLNYEAIVQAKLSLKYDPNSADTVYLLGQTYKELDQTDDSLKYLRQYVAITKDPAMKKSVQQYIDKVSVYANMKSADKCINEKNNRGALKFLQSAAEADPSPYSASVHARMSFVLRELGESEEAIEEGKKALALDPTDKRTTFNMVVAYQDVAKFDQAKVWLKKYMNMETDPALQDKMVTLLHELDVDSKQFNQASNKKADYLDEMTGTSKSKGATWPEDKLPIRVFIASGEGINGFQPKYKSYITHALDTWCVSSKKKLKYKIVKDLSKADIEVSWTTEQLTHNDNQPGVAAGVTTLATDGKKIESADVKILTVDPFNPTTPQAKEVVAFVCLHEIGHALGIGHSSYIYDVMYFRSSSHQQGNPTNRDNSTIARMYSSYPATDFVAQTQGAGPIAFLPPPLYLPPKLKAAPSLAPLLYMPPPLVSERKLEPPLYTPPPLAQQKSAKTVSTPDKPRAPLLFVPPPLERKKPVKGPPKPQLYVPPPLKHD